MNNRNLRLFLSLFAAPVVTLAQGNDASKPNPDLEKAVMKVVHEMSAALTKPDHDGAARMLADIYYAVTPGGGVVNKSEFLADLKSGKFKLETNAIDDLKVHFVDADLAIITYRSTDKGIFDGHDISGQYRWLDVLMKRNGTWQFAVSQGTKLEPPKK